MSLFCSLPVCLEIILYQCSFVLREVYTLIAFGFNVEVQSAR